MAFYCYTSKMISSATIACLYFLLAINSSAQSSAVPTNHILFFNNKVKPLLQNKCMKCHGPKKQKGGLRLDSLKAIATGGDSGQPIIIPHQPLKSLLYISVTHTDPDLQMPEKGKMSDEHIQILKQWIKIGAPWPGQKLTTQVHTPKKSITEKDKQWWSYQPVKSPKIPTTNSNWPNNPIDQFIYAKLNNLNLKPAQQAHRSLLL